MINNSTMVPPIVPTTIPTTAPFVILPPCSVVNCVSEFVEFVAGSDTLAVLDEVTESEDTGEFEPVDNGDVELVTLAGLSDVTGTRGTGEFESTDSDDAGLVTLAGLVDVMGT